MKWGGDCKLQIGRGAGRGQGDHLLELIEYWVLSIFYFSFGTGEESEHGVLVGRCVSGSVGRYMAARLHGYRGWRVGRTGMGLGGKTEG